MGNRLNGYLDLLQNLTPDTVSQLCEFTCESFEFKDPFNHTHTRDDYLATLNYMYQTLDNVRFSVHKVLEQDTEAMIQWTFEADSKLTGPIRFNGMSHIHMNIDGYVIAHIDYWDGSELMERLPFFGRGIGYLRKRFGHH